MSNPEIESAEFREAAKERVEVKDMTAASGLSLEEIADRAVASRLAGVAKDPSLEAWFRRDFEIPEGMPLEQGLREYAGWRAERYREASEKRRQEIQAQAYAAMRYAREKGYIPAERRLTLVMMDTFLAGGIEGLENRSRFNSINNVIFIEADHPLRITAHEVGHLLSRPDTTQRRIGFRETTHTPEGEEIGAGNWWFDEATTLMFEERTSLNDSETRQPDDIFFGFRDTLVMITAEAGVTEDELFRAYFQGGEAQRLLDEKLKQRFNATVREMDCLGYRLDHEWRRDVLLGNPVELTISSVDRTEIVERKETLSRLFPNVRLVRKPE